jgi:hypothetical protein
VMLSEARNPLRSDTVAIHNGAHPRFV